MPTNKKAATKSKINRQWFIARIAERKLSMRRVSAGMGLDESAMSLILAGKRGVSSWEAKLLADQLRVPVSEIMRNLGIDVLDDVHRVPIVGGVNAEGVVTMQGKKADELVTGPADLPNDAIALLCRTAGSRLGFLDGWIGFFSATQTDPASHIGKLVLCATEDGTMRVALLLRGYRPSTYNLMLPGSMVENVAVEWASPLLWSKPLA